VTAAEMAAQTNPGMLFKKIRKRLSPRKRQLLACGLTRLHSTELPVWAVAALTQLELAIDGTMNDFQYSQLTATVQREQSELLQKYNESMQTPEHEIIARQYWIARTVFYATTVRNLSKAIPHILEVYQAPLGPSAKDRELRRKYKAVINPRLCKVIREIVPPEDCLRPQTPNSTQKLFRLIVDEQSFDRLPILADALEDAGFDDAMVLDHFRHGVGHLRGCWALDLMLGRG